MTKTFTENEQRVLNHLPEKIKWFARNEDGNLKFFKEKPLRQKRAGNVVWTSQETTYSANMFKHLFPNVTYLNLEPTEVVKTENELNEKFLLSQINPVYKWIARDQNGLLTLFDKKPTLTKPTKGPFRGQLLWENFAQWHTVGLFRHLFRDIESTNTEPTLIEEYLK